MVPRSVVTSDFIFDYCCVTCYLRVPAAKPMKTVAYRKLKCINHTAFRQDLERLSVVTAPSDDLQSRPEQYCLDLMALLDGHAPLREQRLTLRPHFPWYTVNIWEAEQVRHRYDDKWRSSGLTTHRDCSALSARLCRASSERPSVTTSQLRSVGTLRTPKPCLPWWTTFFVRRNNSVFPAPNSSQRWLMP